MTVFGSNLNAVQNPMMSVSINGQRRHFHDVRSVEIILNFYLIYFDDT